MPRGAGSALGLGLAALAAMLLACAPVVRPTPFRGARDQVTGRALVGPFDGQIVDAQTGEPLPEAVVVGVWSFDTGEGFIGPGGSETIEVRTDAAGRYRIPPMNRSPRGSRMRLVSFTLLVYKRGYVGYRSDAHIAGGSRRDFTVRHNRIELGKWTDRSSHAEHLMFLAAPRDVARAARWERQLANLELYEELGGELGEKEDDEGTPSLKPATPSPEAPKLLDAAGLLSAEDVRLRTGDEGEFEVLELGGLPRTAWYHGVHLQARDRSEDFDVAFRVWHQVPGGMDAVRETLRATLPGVEASPEVTAETYVYEDGRVRAVGFVDTDTDTAVLLTCGGSQCADLETAIILAKFVHGRLELLGQVAADDPSLAPEPATPPSRDEALGRSAAPEPAPGEEATPVQEPSEPAQPSEPEPEPEPKEEPEP